MSTIGGYTTRQFSETQKFLVLDPSTQSTSLVSGSSLIEYIQPRLNSVIAESTRVAAQNTDYKVGSIIQTSGATAPGDNFASTYLVVEGGAGDFPMLNGNDLLLLLGDDNLRDDLLSEDAGKGASLVSMEGGPSVEEAVNQRVIRVSSVAELEALTPSDGWQALLSGTRSGPFKFDASDLSAEVALDTQQGVYIAPASDATGSSGAWVRQEIGNYDPRWFGACGDGSDVLADKQAERAALQGCHDFVNAIGGGTIEYFKPDDRFKIEQGLVLYSNTRYLGNGNDDIIIEQTDANEPVAASEAWWNNTGSDRNIVVDGLYFRGDPAAGANNHGCIVLAFFSTIKNCFAAACGGRGIGFTERYSNGTIIGGTLVENNLINLTTFDCIGVGVFNGETSSAAAILTDGFSDNIIVRQAASPTTNAVQYNCSAGWKIGYHHTYVDGAGAPTDAILIRNPFYTGIDGPFYVERYTRNAVNITNMDRASNLGSAFGNSSSCSDPNAAVVFVSALTGADRFMSMQSVIAIGSQPCYAAYASTSAMNVAVGYAHTNNSPAADGNPLLGVNIRTAKNVDVWNRVLAESGDNLKYDGIALGRSYTTTVTDEVNSRTFQLYQPDEFKGITGTLIINTRQFYDGAIAAQYVGHFSIIRKTGTIYTVDLIDVVNTGLDTGPTLTFNSSTFELTVDIDQTNPSGDGVMTLRFDQPD